MHRASIARALAAIFTTLSLLSVGFAPVVANAQTNMCQAADTSCTGKNTGQTCPSGCVVNGWVVAGVCAGQNDCKAVSWGAIGSNGQYVAQGYVQPGTLDASFANGSGVSLGGSAGGAGGIGGLSMDSIMKYGMMGMMGMSLIQGLSSMFGGSGSSDSSGSGSSPYTNGCTTQYYYTSDPNALSDPCAQYNPNAGNTNPLIQTPSGGCDSICQALGGLNNSSNPTFNGNTSTSSNITSPFGSMCPAVTLYPVCSTGMVVQSGGFDLNGCALAGKCVASNTGTIANSTNPLDTQVNPVTSSSTVALNYPTSLGDTTNFDSGSAYNASTPTAVPISEALTSTIYYNDTTSGSTPSANQTALNQPLSQQLPVNGLHGDIRSLGSGVTIYATSRNGNTAVAGFYGSNSTAGALCQSRPWASNFLSYVIPSTFFDNLCTWAGYPTGPSPQSGPVGGGGSYGRTSSNISVGAPPSASGNQYPNPQQPEVKIWARPASVSIGGRTTIFWTSQYVTACTESSSDGNFSGSSTSGGASTVALSGPVTFNIQCRSLDGGMISGATTVNIGI